MDETDLDYVVINTLREMYYHEPVIVNSRTSILSRAHQKPFTFTIPAIGMMAKPEMDQLMDEHYTRWHEDVFDWMKWVEVCPFYMGREGAHLVPRTPQFKEGRIRVVTSNRRKPTFRWYWYNERGTLQPQWDRNMQWIIGRNHPESDGTIRSPLVALLREYRSGVKALVAQDVVVTRRQQPVHLVEHRTPATNKPQDDHLNNMSADFGMRAVGATRARRDSARVAEEHQRQSNALTALRNQNSALNKSNMVRRVLQTDSDAQLADEADAGFVAHLYALPRDHVYREAGRPDIVVDYDKFKRRFDVQAAAIMDFALELITPTGGTGRSQNVRGAERFELDRVHALIRFFISITRQALLRAYKPQFDTLARNNTDFFPELDVVIEVGVVSSVKDDTLIMMREQGIISHRTMGELMLQNHHIPLKYLELSAPTTTRKAPKRVRDSSEKDDDNDGNINKRTNDDDDDDN